jgi:hypothetical protein
MTTPHTQNAITITVELYGLAHLAARERKLSLTLPAHTTVQGAIAALADACPRLLGKVIAEDHTAFLHHYVFNHNGLTFLEVPDAPLLLHKGDVLIVMSNMAGG